jgi:hypothetical protein
MKCSKNAANERKCAFYERRKFEVAKELKRTLAGIWPKSADFRNKLVECEIDVLEGM